VPPHPVAPEPSKIANLVSSFEAAHITSAVGHQRVLDRHAEVRPLHNSDWAGADDTGSPVDGANGVSYCRG
jgi:hypothetical protein